MSFALTDFNSNDRNHIPILLKINFKGSTQFFSLNTSDLSAFSDEQEILFQEGLQFIIEDVQKETTTEDNQ